MRIAWHESAWADYVEIQRQDPDLLRRLNELIRDTARSPFRGLGKPEPLKGDLSGWWSRRITIEHRLVYRVVGGGPDQTLEIIACRYHY